MWALFAAMSRKRKGPPTAFAQRVYELVKLIPKGKVSTYGAIAGALQPTSCARAVGQAMRNNPHFPVVP